MKQPKNMHSVIAKIQRNTRKQFLAIISTLPSIRPHRQKGRTMRTKFSHALVATFVVATISLLAACGGGGGETPAPVVAPTPESSGTVTAAANTGTINADQSNWSATVTFTTSNVSAGGATLKSDGAVIHSGKTSGTITVPVKVGTTAVTLWDGAKQLGATLNLTGSCAPTLTPDGAGICRAPVGLNKTWDVTKLTILDQGVTFSNWKQLPVVEFGCQSDLQQCWWDSFYDGFATGTPSTVTFLKSTATQLDGKEIWFAVFINRNTAQGTSGVYNIIPVYASNGVVAAGTVNDGVRGPFTKAQANAAGVLYHNTSSNKCFQKHWGGSAWINTETTCPAGW